MKTLRIIHLEPVPWILHQPSANGFRAICAQNFDSFYQILGPQRISLRSNQSNVTTGRRVSKHIPIIGLSIRFQQLTDNLCRKHEFIGTVRPPSTPYYGPPILLYTGAKPIGQLGTQPVALQLRFEVCECGDGASHCVDRCNDTIDV